MPENSVIDETELILLLEYALLSFWDSNFEIKYLSNLKMHKIMYEVSELKDLPITRSWYMLGNNIHEREIVRTEFARDLLQNPRNVTLQNGRVFDVFQLIETYSELFIELKQCVRLVVESTNIVTTNSYEYRRWLYREKAPQKYSLCYQASLEYLALLARFDTDVYLRNAESAINDCTKTTTDLHSSIMDIRDFEIFFQMLVEYTDTIEDAIFKSTLKLQNNSLTTDDLLFLQDQSKIFRDVVWKPFAKVIAIDTVKGNRKDQIKEEYSNDLRDLSFVKLQIEQNHKKAKDLGLFLDKTEFNQFFHSPNDIREKVIEAGNILQWG
jgi:hypothetical protein